MMRADNDLLLVALERMDRNSLWLHIALSAMGAAVMLTAYLWRGLP
jgi:hypothetical protein